MRYPRTEEQRQHWKEYTQRYRREHPDRVKQWRINAALRLADRVRTSQQNQQEGGEQA